MSIVGDVIYVTTGSEYGDSGVTMFKLGTPWEWLARMPIVGGVQDLASDGSVAVVVLQTGAVWTADISNPRAPELLAMISTAGDISDVAIHGSSALVAQSEAGLTIADITDPAAPRVVATLGTPGSALRIQAQEGIAYIADGEGGLRIVDIDDPARPVEVGRLTSLPAPVISLAVQGNIVVAGTGGAGAYVVDVSAPSTPEVLGHIDVMSHVCDIALGAGLGWLLCNDSLAVIDLRDPREPEPIGFEALAPTVAIELSGDRLYLLSLAWHFVFFFDLIALDTSSCTCLADCDGSGALDFADFLCFQNLFAAADPLADCDGSGRLDFFDFLCFQNGFAAGCP